MENKEIGKETEKEKVQDEVNGITVYNNQKLDLPTSSNLLNNPSDFIITQNPFEDLGTSTSAIIHIKNTCKNSFFNCYVNCCFGHSITFNTFLNINQNMKYLFQSTASIIPGFTCLFKRNIELQATFKSFTKSSPEEISSNSGTPFALMDKIDAFSCCNYKEQIIMPVKIIPENRIAGTVVLKPLKEKCPCPGCECIQICKSLNSEDLKNCENINLEKGVCEKCEEGFYLNIGDKKCSQTEHCYESSFGVCQRCSSYYYLNKKEGKCVIQTDNFYNCRESINGETCDVCNDNYYLSEDGKCCKTKYCAEAGNYWCDKCVEGYYLSKDDDICTPEENCLKGKEDIGVCLECIDGYAIDFKDGKCKPNTKNDEFKYCKIADGVCIECLKRYYLGEDNKCSQSRNCSESENGICEVCIDDYYLGLDHKCTNVKHCIYSDDKFNCIECEGDYCVNEIDQKCFIGEDDLENCKFSYYGEWCSICKDDYYLNQSEFLCRSNKDPDYFYKCAKTYSGLNMCSDCVKGYYIGRKDHKCSKIQGCERSEDENTCLECNEYYCLDKNTGNCEPNYRVFDEEKKFYYRCNITNKEGTACEICLDGYTLNDDGLCVNNNNCEEADDDGNCLKCIDDGDNTYCLNKDFGCQNSFYSNCLECDNSLDFVECTKCAEGYEPNERGKCVSKN